MPRRILFIDHTAMLGGGEIALLNLVRHLDRERYVPVVLLFSGGPLEEKLAAGGVETHLLPLAGSVINTRKDTLRGGSLLRLGTIGRTLLHAVRTARLIRMLRVDLVHTNSLKSDVIGALAARLAGKKVIWHMRDRIAADYLPATAVWMMRLLAWVLPNYVIANSRATLRTLLPDDNDAGAAIPSGIELKEVRGVRVVHDGLGKDYAAELREMENAECRMQNEIPPLFSIHHSSFIISSPTTPPPFTARSPLPCSPTAPLTTPLIGLVGRISPWKGQDVFLRAAAHVRRDFPEARFQIIGSALFGEEAYEAQMRGLAAELGLNGAVEFTGFRSDVPQLIEALDVLVHASTLPEPFGQVVVEGMAAGKPVVATDGGGVKEIIEDGRTGLLVPMGNAGAMADALLRLLRDPDLCRRMGEAGARHVRENFTIEQTTAQVQEVYEMLIAGKW